MHSLETNFEIEYIGANIFTFFAVYHMKDNHSKYLIIGGGLTGLSLAYFLEKEKHTDIKILESRDRTGGRIKTAEGIDFGATWFNESHQNLLSLLNELNLGKFEQFNSGKSLLIYNSMAPPHLFESPAQDISTFRIAGGSRTITDMLSNKLAAKIMLNTQVVSAVEKGNHIEVKTTKGLFTCEKLISTLPPNLALNLNFIPKLDIPIMAQMKKTHTWMSNAIKVGLGFPKPFWRENGFSGTLMSQISPVIELYDHCSMDDSEFALMGFVNEGLRMESSDFRKEKILSYLEKHLGSEIRNYTYYYEKDWSQDENTSKLQPVSTYMSPEYGHPLFDQWHWSGKLRFSGTETAKQFGGYLEGAIISAKTVVADI